MTELVYINLILGSIGTLMGIISLIIHLREYKKNKSILDLEWREGTINKGEISFQMYLHNRGNLLTSITHINILLTDKFGIKAEFYELQKEDITSKGANIKRREKIVFPLMVLPNTSKFLLVNLLINNGDFNKIVEKVPIKCGLTINHTHSKKGKDFNFYIYNTIKSYQNKII